MTIHNQQIGTASCTGNKSWKQWGRVSKHTHTTPWHDAEVINLLRCLNQPVCAIEKEGDIGYAIADPSQQTEEDGLPIVGCFNPGPPEILGSAAFREVHGLKYAYYAGAMANGISSVNLVTSLGQAGMLSFFGAAGLAPQEVESAITTLQQRIPHAPWGMNLIHSPNESALESAVADLYIRTGVSLVEAAAYIALTLPLIRYRTHGIHSAPDGRIITPNRIIAKVSREEVAERFLSPPPEDMLRELVNRNELTEEQAQMASRIPVAEDITAEADSAGHTDNRPALALLPTIQGVRDRLYAKYAYDIVPRVGLAGSISTPAAAAAAFALGADWIVTGSFNQACIESGASDDVRKMLAETRQADVVMAPAADMFEMGVNVQVLKRGTMFAMRAKKLYTLYNTYDQIESIPAEERDRLEKTIFQKPLAEVWQETQSFFADRDPSQIERAERDPKHKMALTFRWYLGQSSGWANRGVPERKMDYQIWCGPAMGAFNEWTAGTCLAEPSNRRVVDAALNILFGAAYYTRRQNILSQGLPLPPDAAKTVPLKPESIEEYLNQ